MKREIFVIVMPGNKWVAVGGQLPSGEEVTLKTMVEELSLPPPYQVHTVEADIPEYMDIQTIQGVVVSGGDRSVVAELSGPGA